MKMRRTIRDRWSRVIGRHIGSKDDRVVGVKKDRELRYIGTAVAEIIEIIGWRNEVPNILAIWPYSGSYECSRILIGARNLRFLTCVGQCSPKARIGHLPGKCSPFGLACFQVSRVGPKHDTRPAGPRERDARRASQRTRRVRVLEGCPKGHPECLCTYIPSQVCMKNIINRARR